MTAAVPARERLERIELVDASVQLGSHWAVQDASIDIRAGERWLLLGANGAGKTVLLKLLRGDFWPTPTGREARRYHLRSGEVLTQPMFAMGRIAYLGPERQDRYERYESTLDVAQVVLTGFDESDFPLTPATPSQRRRIQNVLQQVGLAGWSQRAFRSLSYGQRRRVLLARAMVREPDVLLLDEALNGLDAKGRAAFQRALRKATSPRTAYVLSSHRRADAPPDLTHVAEIRAGQLKVECVGTAVRGNTRSHAKASHRHELAAVMQTSSSPSSAAAASLPSLPVAPSGLFLREASKQHALLGQRDLLRLERAAVFRGERAVIGAFDWTLTSGEHWCLRGANGAGKSTLMAVLYGDLWPAHGGLRTRRWSIADDWKARVGLVSPELQASYAATACTVEEIVASGLHSSIGLNAAPTALELRKVRRELRGWNLEALATRRARELSYGQLRLALVARAFVRSRKLFLLDEPFDGLDAVARALLRARLDQAVRRGATLVIATHHAEDVPAYVKTTLHLRRGRAPQVERT